MVGDNRLVTTIVFYWRGLEGTEGHLGSAVESAAIFSALLRPFASGQRTRRSDFEMTLHSTIIQLELGMN
jgi:hypothetical protein